MKCHNCQSILIRVHLFFSNTLYLFAVRRMRAAVSGRFDAHVVLAEGGSFANGAAH